ncbi:MAG: GNAT family N-acetyltransferase [Halapricum sp.]
MPGPVFQSGERVNLHTVEEEDLDAFARARSDPDLRLPLCIDSPANRDALETFYEETISDDEGAWFVAAVDDETVGAVMFTAVDDSDGVGDLAYWILPEHQNEGYGREAVSLLLDYGFEELRLNRAQADILATNEPSRGLLESLGFSQEGRFREAAFQAGTYVDVLRYGLLADEWGES